MAALSIILPTYNEVDNIVILVEAIERELSDLDHEVIVVDDNSPDGTSAAVRQAMESLPNLRLVTRMEDPGLVQAIQEGVRQARSDVCLWMDADLSMPPSAIRRLFAEIQAGADIAVGSRYVSGGGIKGSHGHEKISLLRIWHNLADSEDSFLTVLISSAGNAVVRHLLDPQFRDYTSGFYAVRKTVFDQVSLEGHYLDYCIAFLYRSHLKGFRIKEIPVVIAPRQSGTSKTSGSLGRLLTIIQECFWMVGRLMAEGREHRRNASAKL
jgi:dolichol-phosphate mannosyltransferase